jgi:hypothetical protein
MTKRKRGSWRALVHAASIGYGYDELRGYKEVDNAILWADSELHRLLRVEKKARSILVLAATIEDAATVGGVSWLGVARAAREYLLKRGE